MQKKTPDIRLYYGTLRAFHSWGYLTLSNLRDLLLANPNTIRPYLERLIKEKYIVPVGYPPYKGGTNPLYGYYYSVTRKEPPSVPTVLKFPILPRDFRVFKYNEDYELPQGSVIFKESLHVVKKHQLWVSNVAAWMNRIMVENFEHDENIIGSSGFKTKLVPEYYLKKQGWHGRGAPPASGEPFLTMVPDFVLNFEHFQAYIQVELTIKTRARYERDFEIMEPQNQNVIYIVPTAKFRDKIKKVLPKKYNIDIIVYKEKEKFCELINQKIAESISIF